MAKPGLPRLKVFQAQFGFYDTVIAAPSQAAALRAWGTRQNLFASGDAKLTIEPDAVAAAIRHPGAPLRRAMGSTDPFQLEPSSLPRVPDAGRPRAANRAVAAGDAGPKPPPADRTELNAAEAALRAIDEARRRQEQDFRARELALGAAKAAAQAAYVEARKAATAAIVQARQRYRAAGGEA